MVNNKKKKTRKIQQYGKKDFQMVWEEEEEEKQSHLIPHSDRCCPMGKIALSFSVSLVVSKF
jgi:hypothetical protein